MALLSWFRKKPADEDYEQVLASLALSVQKRQTQLSEIRLRERRATLLVTAWAFAGWAAYVGLWWTGVLGRARGFVNGLWGVPVVVGPVVILFTRRIVQLWYARKGNAEEKMLKALLVQRRNKIEEIKKKTNYYTTKNLLERYDNGTPPRSIPGESPSVQIRGPPSSPQPRVPPTSLTPTQGQLAPQTPVKNGPPGSPAFPPLPPPRKQWYDKLADALLGDDTASTGPSPASRYALICERCFTHNGLVKEEQWEEAQYICPKCGHFNPPARARKSGPSLTTTPTSPQPPVTPSRSQERSVGLSPEPQSLPPAPNLTPSHREPSSKSLLSASTVLVEKDDVEQEDESGDSEEHESDSRPSADTTVQMEVDA